MSEFDEHFRDDDGSVDVAKLRGSMLSWIKQRDTEMRNQEGLSMHNTVSSEYRRYMMNEVDGFRQEVNKYAFRKTISEEIKKMWNKHDEFRRLCENMIVSVPNDQTEKDAEYTTMENGLNQARSSSSDGDDDGDDDSPPDDKYEKAREVGLLDGADVDKNKLRGTMIKFVKDVDVITGNEPEVNEDEVREAWLRYMQEKLGKEWTHFLKEHLDYSDHIDVFGAMWDRHDDFADLAASKYEQDEDEVEGNTDGDDSSVDTPSTLDGWADKSDELTPSETNSVQSEHRERQSTLRDRESIERYDEDEIRNDVLNEDVWSALKHMPSSCVDMVITSPPYYQQREYEGDQDCVTGGRWDCSHTFVNGVCRDCGAYKGELGGEPSPDKYVDNMVAIANELQRVVKPSGSFWFNIGDKFAGEDYSGQVDSGRKSMMMLPDRVYMNMIDDGWVLRNKIVWAKQIINMDDEVTGAVNPASVTDRVMYQHEPLYFFSNGSDYYCDLFEVRRETTTDPGDPESFADTEGNKYKESKVKEENMNSPAARAARDGYTPSLEHDVGANIPDVWRVPTGSESSIHSAVFSEELPVRPIHMTCPEKVCDMCGRPYLRNVTDGEHDGWERQCNCPTDDVRPGVVLDPFAGRGTTLKVAYEMGRDYIGIEISDDYMERLNEYVPDRTVDGQMTLQ